ncbi:hypothetical protein ALC57_15446 [Trachymyrmex cornetzi]|uniref:Uncharacterized protein n=1 Tax=Trachymyrmex cornetzi TaxID=471704 RepID=A0A151IX50_9HYME|nr:hypothetical protein ALC57_15446 [Trachymyrmex cornetzi]
MSLFLESLPGNVVISVLTAVKEKVTLPKRQRPSKKHLFWMRILPHSSIQIYIHKHSCCSRSTTREPTTKEQRTIRD